MMSTPGPLIVNSSPGDRELLPVADPAVGHLGDRDAAGSPQRGSTWPSAVTDTHTFISASLLAGAEPPPGTAPLPGATACSALRPDRAAYLR